MDNGNIMQIGTPKEIYELPNSRFVANFMGKANFIEGEIAGNGGGCTVIKVADIPIKIPKPGNAVLKQGNKAFMAVRPESIKLVKEEDGTFNGVILRAIYYGSKVAYEIKVAQNALIVESYNPQLIGMFVEGDTVGINLDLECIRILL